MLRKLLLARIQSAILERPRPVLVASILLALVAIAFGLRVEFRSSRAELAPPDDPDQQRWSALAEEYSGSEALIAAVEAIPGESDSDRGLRAFVDRLADEFRGDPLVDNVFHRVDVDWFLDRGLYLLAPDQLEAVRRALDTEGTLLHELGSITSIERLNRRIAERIERGRREGAGVPEQGSAVIGGLTRLLRFQRDFMARPAETMDRLERTEPLLAVAGDRAPGLPGGYLGTRDGSTLFVIVSPENSSDGLPARRALLAAMRGRVETVTRLMPGYRVAFTGQPALVVEEMETVRTDTWLTSITAVMAVTVLTLFVFRWRSHAFLVLAALALGIIWSFGAVFFEYGYLNLITSSFISTLVGVGVAYGIHPVSEYELEGAHTSDPVATVRESFHRTGAGVTVAAATTATAFFSIPMMRFRGFAELGLVAGVGVLLCLAAATVTLPALLVVYGTWRRRRDAEGRKPAVVDRVWVELVAAKICRFPRLTTLVALALTAGMAWAAAGLGGVNTNILDLLPRNAESARYQHKMMMESDLSPQFNIVVADDLETLEALQERARAEPHIDRFESVLDFLPRDPQAAQSLMHELGRELDTVDPPAKTEPLTRAGFAESCARLERSLADSADDAFAAGLAELAGPLEDARAEAEACAAEARRASDEAIAAWNREQPRLLRMEREALEGLRRCAAAEPPSLTNLPEAIRDRFVTRDGRMLGFLFPAGNVFDPTELEDYVAASRRVSAEATGFPLVFHKMSRRITAGFRRAVLAGSILVTLILLLDYRNPRDALLALVPLAMGVVWMMGAMRCFGISFNFANLVAVPLIIGVGIDNGVHVIHRVRLEGRDGMSLVLRHTGRAILIASLTTMIGFGSLALASHRGLASLGLVLLLGVGSCLLTSTVVLPNLLVTLGLVKR